MRAGGLGGLLTLFTALFLWYPTAVRSSDLPPLYNVTVMCDSYGVVVSWESSHHQQQFILTVKPNMPNGTVIHINTRKTQYNISEHLLDPAFNRYLVDVQTEDGKYADSKVFTYNSKQDGIQCNLTFPPVELIPGDYQLTVKFRNPFHLYRDTPALRQLQERDTLDFSICPNKNDHSDHSQDSCVKPSFTCTQDSDTCEGTVPFPKEQEEYCVTLSGSIRQTYVQETESCYRGSLKPSIPITVYIIPVCVLLGIGLIIGFMMFLAKKINKNIKEKIRSNLPDFLVETSYTHPFNTLIAGPEPVERNPLVGPVIIIPIRLDLPANTRSCGSLMDLEDDPGRTRAVCVQEAEVVVEAEERKDEAIGGLETGYDMPHGPLLERRAEFSPGDFVNTYNK
ncbi:interferon gamma receptor 1 precursor [Astyanax mexicanus]|uniref:Interferon gamma receptor 1 n=1 Tax=Astyanax mexicanus TaxID=7994 RepID=A0A3B1INT5_ASTMX|nr:interferon gamma receptor 1 precursor [Astyanax mexicanus]